MVLKEIVKKFIPSFLVNLYHLKLAWLGAMVFGFPSRDMAVIGVTGTSGKSTTVDLITRILEEQGHKVASISTVRFKIGDEEWENRYKMTMPGRFVIQKFLKQAKDCGCAFAVLEVSSQGIEQHRHRFIKFDAAVFTNLTPEHIEAHGGFENYRARKLKFFGAVKNIHIMNADDSSVNYFMDLPAQKKYAFGMGAARADGALFLRAENIIEKENGVSFSVEKTDFNLGLMGRFNVYNALAAIATALAYGILLDVCKKALEKAKGVIGRMEVVSSVPFHVVVDYAHTPEQLEAVYKSFASKELVCVLGSCGGGRDKWKRPVLGKIAAQYCRNVIITNEDPYDEDPDKIMREVADGAGEKAEIIPERKEAIQKAIALAKPGDAVIITGKGSEPWMCLANGKKVPWSDSKTAREALVNLDKN